MKKRLVSHVMLGLSLAALPFLGGCSQQSADGSNPLVSTANAEPVLNETNLVLEAAGPTNFTVAEARAPAAATSAVPAVVPISEPILPSNLHLSPSLAEVTKLAQSGVDETVLLNFITNTTGVFVLGADEIVYLNDLGVPGHVITTMMQHDQALKELRMNAFQAQAAAAVVAASNQAAQVEEPVASAPSYVDAPAAETEPAYVSDNYFYDTLSPYGSWVYVTGYGRCWRPTVGVCNPGWRPYCDRGRWVYSDCGWYWLSDYSWGATTFHYGRWFNQPSVGWCWWPDNVWAPSWVSWRYTSDYCGWAPLPPTACYQSGFGLMYQNGSVGTSFGFGLGVSDYAFLPWGSFCSPHPYQHCLPPRSAAFVYNNSTPVNHYEAGGQGRVFNRGIAPDQVRNYSRTEIRTVSIRDEQVTRGRRAEQLDRDGRTLAVRRPHFPAASVGGGKISEPSSRGAGRNAAPRANETVISKSPLQPTPTSPNQVGRTEVRTERNRTVAPLVPTDVSTAATKPSVRPTQPGRGEQRIVSESPAPTRVTSPVAVYTPPVTPIAPTPTKVQQPRVVQVTPQTVPRPTAPSTSVIVIGGKDANRSGGRDYSVYSTPRPSPAPNTPISSPRDNFSPRAQSPNVSSRQIVENSPAPASPAPSYRSYPSRNDYGRSENRSSYPNYPAPSQAGQVVPPTVRSVPTPSYTPRPAPSSPAPGNPRVEARPAASAPVVVPATSRSDSGQGRPNR